MIATGESSFGAGRIVPPRRGPVAGTRKPVKPFIREWHRLGENHAIRDWLADSPLIA